MTERDIFSRLATRYPHPAFVLLSQVRNATGFERGPRTADAIAFGTWPSRGLDVTGFEIKCSTSDWRREVAEPAKAAEFTRYMDRWYIVAPAGIVPIDEVPERWGLLETRGKGLRCVREAPKLTPEPMSRAFLASIMRNFQATYDDPKALEAAKDKAFRDGAKKARENMRTATISPPDRELVKRAREFESAAGFNLAWRRAGDLGRVAKQLLDGEASCAEVRRRLERAHAAASDAVQMLGKRIEELEK